jgi:hypothetical protein
MSSKSQGRVGVYLAKKNTILKYKKLLHPDDIVPSIVPPPSRRPTQLLYVPPPIALLALPITAWVALRVSYSQLAVPRICVDEQ